MSQIVVTRIRQVHARGQGMVVYVDDKKKGTVGHGKSKTIDVKPGKHKLYVTSAPRGRSSEVSVRVAGDETVTVEIGSEIQGAQLYTVLPALFRSMFTRGWVFARVRDEE